MRFKIKLFTNMNYAYYAYNKVKKVK